jgi:hypothetical protein
MEFRPGDLVQVLEAPGRSIWAGKIAMVVGDRTLRAGESEYVQVMCEGVRIMPSHWLRRVER